MTTIRQRLTRALVLGFSVLLALAGVAVFVSTRTALLKQFDSVLLARAAAVMALTEQDEDEITVEGAERIAGEFEPLTVNGFVLRDAAGRVVAASGSGGRAGLMPPAGQDIATATAANPVFWDATAGDGTPIRAMALSFQPRVSREAREHAASSDRSARSPAAPQAVTLVVASDRRTLNRTVSTIAFSLGGVGVLMLLATIALVPPVLRQGLRPIDGLAQRASTINADTLSTRFSSDGLPRELVPIALALDGLMSRVEGAFEEQRRFSADLAHELRTPIAAVRTLAESALRWPESRDANTDADVLMVARHMEGLVARLLTLLRTERGQLQPEWSDVDLGLLVRSCWAPFEARADERRLVAHISVASGLCLRSDWVLLRSVLTNLLDNAVAYATPGTPIEVRAVAAGSAFSLTVMNSTEPLPEADVHHLFDRFWRKDASRTATEHSGLGLPLARGFAEAMGCQLRADLAGATVLRLTLSGPLRPAGS